MDLSSLCPGSVHMRLRRLSGAALFQILFWGKACKGAVGAVMVVEVLKAVEDGIKGFDGFGEIVSLLALQLLL